MISPINMQALQCSAHSYFEFTRVGLFNRDSRFHIRQFLKKNILKSGRATLNYANIQKLCGIVVFPQWTLAYIVKYINIGSEILKIFF